MKTFHTPALLKEAVNALNIRPGGVYIDATLGGAGHTEEILKRGGKVLGIDQDQDALGFVEEKYASYINNQELALANGNFKDIERIAREKELEGADGILFDLGVSSYQIDYSGRGFSFLREEPLDMRMGKGELTAKEIVNKASYEELYNIFTKFGEEKDARAISNSIISARSIKPIETSSELSQIVAREARSAKIPFGGAQGKHPATRVFQALRIAVNSEIDNLKEGLTGAFNILNSRGRLAVISFHSLEDRVVKLYFTKLEREGKIRFVNKKPIIASLEEIRINRRARSAKLRAIEKI